MKLHTTYLEGAVLPTVVVAALVMLTATLGLLALWEQETLLFTRTQRLRQARADVESAALLYRLHPDERALTAAGGYLLYDSLPQSRIFVRREPWGLYELLRITTADSLVASSRIVGAEPDPARTLFYADDRTAVTLAGDTRLHGTLRLPQNGLTYGRVGAEFYRGEEVPRTAIRSSAAMLPAPSAAVAARIGALFAFAQQLPAAGDLPDSLGVSFRDPTVALRLGTAEIGGCTLRGRIVLAADELRIDSACRLENVLVCARKITVGSGARIAAQLFARDTVVVEPCAVLEYPSGIYAGRYAELGDRATADGYVIVERTLEDEVEVLNVPLPAVLCVTSDINTPKIPAMKAILGAGKKPVTQWSAADINWVPVPEQVKFVSLSAPQQAERKRVVIEGDSPQAISELADHLRKAMN